MIPPRTLFGKLLLLFLGFGAVMTGALIFMMSVAHQRYHLEFDQMVNRGLAQQYVTANLLVTAPQLTPRDIPEALRRITSINPNIDAYVLDGRGDILYASTVGKRAVLSRVDIEPIARFLSDNVKLPLLDFDPTSARSRDVFSVAPLSIPGSAAAYLYLVLDRRNDGALAQRLQTTYDLGEDAGVILIAALFAVTASIVFLRILTRRLGTLQQDMQRFRDEQLILGPSDATAREPSPGDEIERLRHEFLQLSQCIREQTRELTKNDGILRELLANVSHDLRTPLTTLQMQLERLSLKRGLPEEERQEGIAVALQQSRRLGALTGQLLELAKLDAGQLTYSPERFQIAELAQDTLLTYELEARKARVALSLAPPTQAVPRVVGDIVLLGRVLEILLQNALRHAGAGGRVTVSLVPRAGLVRVSVHDTGPGILQADREHVFERFYRGDKSRSTRTGNAGLGLAIARGILRLHGQSIDFVSEPGQGTTFFFDLSTASSMEDDRRREAPTTAPETHLG